LMGIGAVIADLPPRHRPPSKAEDAMRSARTCYDHLAGKLGVDITDTLCDAGHLRLSDDGGELAESGIDFFEKLGVDLAATRGRRMFCRPCLDWTERRPHLAGALGAALACRCFELKWLQRVPGGRALTVTVAGRRGLRDAFGLSLQSGL